METSAKPSSLKELISDSHVFLTGVTGFVGGVLLERLLSMDPGPKKIYVLIRKKKGIDPQERLNQLFSRRLFSGVPQDRFQKVHVIDGECGLKNLGISDEDRWLLTSECDLVFHSAALVSFGAPYNRVARINTMGTQSVMNLAKEMPKIKAMVHVSTSYLDCDKSETHGSLMEQVYPTAIDPVAYLEMAEQLSTEEFRDYIRTIYNKECSNSYAVSKAMTEYLLEKQRGDLPVAIVRPSLVFNTWKEPIPGWVDNLNSGAVGAVAGISYGIVRCLLLPEGAKMDIIPADMVASTVLAAALCVAQDSSKLKVFNCTSGSVNPLSMRDWYNYVAIAARNNPVNGMVLYPNVKVVSNKLRHIVRTYVFQILLTYMLMPYIWLAREKRGYNLLDHQRLHYKASFYLYRYLLERWDFERSECDKLIELLPPDEREKHPMNPKPIDWEKFAETCVLGVRKDYLNDEVVNKKTAVRTLFTGKVIWLSSPVLAFLILCYLFSSLGCSTQVSLFFSYSIIAFLVWL